MYMCIIAIILSLFQPRHASSLEKAYSCYSHSHIPEPILVGGKHFISINGQEILNMTENQPDTSEVVGTLCRSMFFGDHGVKGMLYRVGEHILISDSTNQDNRALFTLQLSFLSVLMISTMPLFKESCLWFHQNHHRIYTAAVQLFNLHLNKNFSMQVILYEK